jgi:membrane protein
MRVAKDMFIIKLIRRTFAEWSQDKAYRMAASLSYFTAFALAPLLVVCLTVVGAVYGQSGEVRAYLIEQLTGVIGADGARAIQTIMENLAANESQGWLATAGGIAILVYASVNVFMEIQDSFNTIWEVQPKPRSWWESIRYRLLSFAMVMGIAFLLVVSLVVSTAVTAVVEYVGLAGQASALEVVNFLLNLGVITVLFAMMFKLLPDARVRWGDVWIGALITAGLFTLGKWALGLYLAKSGVASVYGAAASLAVVLIWVYYSSQILFLGAEFTFVYSHRHGEQVGPDESAVKLTDGERVQQGIPREETVEAAVERDESASAGGA